VQNPSGSPDVPAAVRALMTAHGMASGALRRDGRLTLTFEDRYRVHLEQTRGRRLAVFATVLDLADRLEKQEVDRMLQTLAARGTGLMQSRASTLSFDASRHRLLLQQTLPADIGLERLEFELAEFVAALAFWTQTGIVQELGST